MIEFLIKYWLEVVFGLIVTGLTAGVAKINKKLKDERKRNQAIEDGVRDLLRLQILDAYDRCIQSGRMITVSRKDAIDSAYRSYHALGGNGTITQVHTEIMQMPII